MTLPLSQNTGTYMAEPLLWLLMHELKPYISLTGQIELIPIRGPIQMAAASLTASHCVGK